MSQAKGWNQAEDDEASPYEDTISPGNVGSLSLDWTYTTGAGIYGPPSVVNGVLYSGSDDGNVYALNATTGAQPWSFAAGAQIESSPAVVNGVVYIGDNAGTVYAISASTGTELWSYTTGGYLTSQPVIVNGMVYQAGFDGTIYAFSLPGAADAAARGQARPAVSALRPNRSLKVTR